MEPKNAVNSNDNSDGHTSSDHFGSAPSSNASPINKDSVISDLAPPTEAGMVVRPGTLPEPMSGTPNSTAPLKPKRKTKWLKWGLLVLALAVIIGGGSAAAYYTVYVPNKPQNRILSSVVDITKHKQMTIKGSVEQTGSIGFSADYNLALDQDSNLFKIDGKVGVNGVPIPYDIRYIDKGLYVKVSGLSALGTLAGQSQSELLSSVGPLLSTIDDKWVVIDQSFFNQAAGTDKSKCASDISFKLTDDDLAKFQSAYKKHPLFKVKSSSSADVDGTSTTKYRVIPTGDAEAAQFAKDLETITFVKKIKDCTGADSASSSDQEIKSVAKSAADDEIYLYVTNDKQLKKVEVISTDNGTTSKFNGVFNYGPIKVDKPEGAKSILDLLGGLMGGNSPGNSTNSQLYIQCAKAFEEYANSNGMATIPSECAALQM